MLHMKKCPCISLILGLLILSNCKFRNDPKTEIFEIASREGDKVFIKRKVWGLTDDHQLTVVSNTNTEILSIPDSINDYVFRGPDPFVYSLREDTLILFVRKKVHMPPNFNHQSIYVLQREVSSSEYSDLIRVAISGSEEFLKL